MEITKTSFGEMSQILKSEGSPVVEHLKFESAGRFHKHKENESFFVLSGAGQVISGEKEFKASPGCLIAIPANVPHRMIPGAGQCLEGILWYHKEDRQILD